jgi:hypothetical protein
MKTPTASTRRQLLLLSVLAGILVLAVVKWGGKGPTRVAAGPAASAPGSAASSEEERPAPGARVRASREKKVEPADVPFIRVQDLNAPRGRRGEEDGRNIFDFRAPTIPPPPTPTPAPPPPPAPGSKEFIGPMPPPGPTPTPVPPEINFKFLGTFGPRDQPIAVLLQGDRLLNAHAGDVVFGRFVLRNIGYESIDVGFVGYPPGVTKRLGITS